MHVYSFFIWGALRVDIGCGSGRVVGWLAVHYPRNKVIGIEIDPIVAADTKKRMKKYKRVEIIAGNAITPDFLKQGTIFYLFYPFHEQPMRQFVEILKTIKQQGIYPATRPLIIYHNCGHLNIFEEDETWKIKNYGELNGLPTAILIAAV